MASPMTPRQRLFAALSGQPTDRVPVWLLFPYHPTGYYADVRNNPHYTAIFEASRDFAIMLDRRHFGRNTFAPQVQLRSERLHEGNWQVDRQIIEHAGRRLVAETRRGPESTIIKKLLDNEDDLRAYASLPINLDEKAIVARLEEQLPKYLAEKAEFPERYGAMMLDLGEPIGMLYHQSNLEEFSIWSLMADDVVIDLLDRSMQQYRIVYRWCLEHDLADVYFMVGSELASPPLVSRKTFQRWIVPYARELIDMVHSYGKYVIQHYHGQISEILPDFLTMGADGLHTIEAPPTGDCTMTQAYEVVGDKLTLIGNVQYDCFRSHTASEMQAEVRALIEECRGKRFILSPSAGPYEQEISPRIIENYLAFLRTAAE